MATGKEVNPQEPDMPVTELISETALAVHSILSLGGDQTKINIRDFRQHQRQLAGLFTLPVTPQVSSDKVNPVIAMYMMLASDLSEFDTTPLPVSVPREFMKRVHANPIKTMSEQEFAKEMQIELLRKLGEEVDSSPAANIFADVFFSSSDLDAVKTPFASVLIHAFPKGDSNDNSVVWMQHWRQLQEIYSFIHSIAQAKYVGAQVMGKFLDVLRDQQIQEFHVEFLQESELEDLSEQLIQIFDTIASDDRVYEKNGKTVRNSDVIKEFLASEPNMKEALLHAMASDPSYTTFYNQLASVLSDTEDVSSVVMESARALAELDAEGVRFTQLNGVHPPTKVALQALSDGSITPDVVAKAVIADLQLPPANRDASSSGLLRAAVRNAIEQRPDLFNGHADSLARVFDALDEEIVAKRSAIHIDQETQAQIHEKISKGAPIIYDFWETGFGDMLLSLPAIQALVESISAMESTSPVYFVVNPMLVPLFFHAIAPGNPRVRVIGIDNTDAETAFLELMSQGKNKSLPPVLLEYRMNAEEVAHYRAQGMVVQKLAYFMGKSEDTLVRLREKEIEEMVGVQFTDSQRTNAFKSLSNAAREYIQDYAPTHVETARAIEKITNTDGFKNGYIAIVSNGSTKTKQMTPEILQLVVDHLHAYCTTHDVGVVLLDTSFGAKSREAEMLDALRTRGVPACYMQVRKDMPIEHSLAILSAAQALIGPDSSLPHGVSLVNPRQPKFIISVDADVEYWQFPESNVIAAMHPIAHAAREENDRYGINVSLHLGEYLPPLSENIGRRGRKLHPLLAAMQRQFARELHSGLDRLVAELTRQDTTQ